MRATLLDKGSSYYKCEKTVILQWLSRCSRLLSGQQARAATNSGIEHQRRRKEIGNTCIGGKIKPVQG